MEHEFYSSVEAVYEYIVHMYKYSKSQLGWDVGLVDLHPKPQTLKPSGCSGSALHFGKNNPKTPKFMLQWNQSLNRIELIMM